MIDRKKKKRNISAINVDKGFITLLKVESALRGKSVLAFTREVADNEKLFTEYLSENKPKGLKRKNGFGFDF